MISTRILRPHENATVSSGTLTSAATLNINAAQCTDFEVLAVTLTGNATLAVPTNGRTGQRLFISFTSDASARTLSLNASILGTALLDVASAGVGVIAATKTRMLELIFNGTAWVKVYEQQLA